jgi:hypothetical protein
MRVFFDLASAIYRGSALGALLLGAAAPAHAAYTVIFEQEGSDVVATGSGAIDTAGLVFVSDASALVGINPSQGYEVSGFYLPIGETFQGITGPASYGDGGFQAPDVNLGELVGIIPLDSVLVVHDGYVSGSPLTDTATYDNATFASLGLTPGKYVYTWGSGADADSFTIQIGVPEPSTWAMMLVGFGGLGFAGWRAQRRPAAIAA